MVLSKNNNKNRDFTIIDNAYLIRYKFYKGFSYIDIATENQKENFGIIGMKRYLPVRIKFFF